MKILVINSGSSSIKYQLFDMVHHTVLTSGIAEKIGEDEGLLTHEIYQSNEHTVKSVKTCTITNHRVGLIRIVDLLLDQADGVIRDILEISAVGHRVVHGGETLHSPTVIDEKVISAIKDNIPLAPLHNPSNLTGIEVAKSIFPHALQVAVFDTAFHQTIPIKAFLYAIPFDMYEKGRIRKYGFHGTSHAYVAERAAEYMGRPKGGLNLITIHLGNGASMAAVKNGECIDTTMGFTPLAGLVMGTRCGDVDPALPFFLAENFGMSLQEINTLLNKESGLKGLCGTNDMREVITKYHQGDSRAKIALDVYSYRIKKYIGAYFAILGSLDCLVFTAGIGENSAYIRNLCCSGLGQLGIEIDSERNSKAGKGVREISSLSSIATILVIPTNEEFKIAEETKKIIELRRQKK
ncbi:MAG: acetate kinase [Candidatus Scalindua sp. AMX11]|nr:MAG: acetate kinase [Candidatus Scalindua sp.]NOG84301.1 acetate kinase [Planctomycetota bacterium]RZV66424.1 MAG: acetate kinase [Candidatus Scalindua sp. SCAELEC01]TDE63593.1 MAG: acetate kinase [Candidatus Scalindua sp. AMX11]GJQ57244.1 MAG: acetate kinase [Candidatus Scalindua sp.]